MHSALPPATKSEVIKLNYKKGKSKQNSQAVEKVQPMQKYSMKKVVESKVVAQNWLVIAN